MKEINYIKSEHFMGFEVESAEDAVHALGLGLDIINQDGLLLQYSIKDEDGNERDRTDSEIIEDIAEDLKNGSKVYAGSYLRNSEHFVVGKKTFLTSDIGVGDKVYMMKDNKIREGEITYVRLATDNAIGIYGVRILGTTIRVSPKDFFRTKEELIKHLLED